MALPLIDEQSAKSQRSIPLTGSPDGGCVALQLSRDVFAPLTSRDTQNDASTPNLIPRRRVTMSHALQLGDIRRQEFQLLRLSSTHASTSHAKPESSINIAGRLNLVQVSCRRH